MHPGASWGDPILGAQVGAFRVERLLGEGGMGRVYAGIEAITDRPVAIKVIAEEHARDAELVRRFYAEADAASRIRHPSIVEVLDLTYLPDGRPAIVMELVDGRTLRDAIEAGPIAIDVAVDVIAQVLDAIAAAHAAGIIHRDLKPDNIVIAPTGVAKVLDFGIAKLAAFGDAGGAPRTRTGMMLGTPDYMPPEQITGGSVDGRTDIYALGVVLFETLTGRRPFTGDNQFALLRAHIETPPPWPGELRADIPDALSQVIVTALAKAPASRFATPTTMLHALQAAVHQRGSTPSLAPSLASVTLPPARRARRAWPGIAAALVALAGIAAGAVVIAKRRAPATASDSLAPATATASNPHAPSAARGATATPPVPATTPVAPATPATSPDSSNGPPPADLHHFDPTASQAELTRLAREKIADAELFYMQFNTVRADGTVDLQTAGSVTFMFWSPSMAKQRPADLAANVPYRAACRVVILVSPQLVQVTRTTDACDHGPTHPPRCSLRQVWDRARKRGAKDRYAADISFVDGGWNFSIYNVPPADEVSLHWKDDCT